MFTDESPLSFEMRNLAGAYDPDQYEVRWTQTFAAHLDVFVLLGLPGDSASGRFIGAWPERNKDGDWSARYPHHVLEMSGQAKGSYVTRVDGLSESLSRAVAPDSTYDSAAPQVQARVRVHWDQRAEEARANLDLAAEFEAAGREWSEVDDDGRVVRRVPLPE